MEYIASMLVAIKQGMDLGANVIGYLHWSLLDNWEWEVMRQSSDSLIVTKIWIGI